MQNIEKNIHLLLHQRIKSFTLNSEIIEINRVDPINSFIEYKFGRYQKAHWNSPGIPGELVRKGHEVTLCIFTGQPWRLIVDGAPYVI
jgi:hypothetical protein